MASLKVYEAKWYLLNALTLRKISQNPSFPLSGEGSQPQVKKNQNATKTSKIDGLYGMHRPEMPSFLRRCLRFTPQIGTLKKREGSGLRRDHRSQSKRSAGKAGHMRT